MAGQTNLQKDVLVLNMEQQLSEIAQSMFDKKIAELTDQELYYVVLILTKRLMKVSDENEGEKKVYYISAEFLIGKLLSNNLINLGVYDKMAEILNKYGKKLSVIEEIAYENGWISKDRLLESAERYGKSVYGQHLKKVVEGKIIPHKEYK